MRAVRFTNPQGAVRIGALEHDTVRDAGPAGPQGFVPTEQAWAELGRADGPEYALERGRPAAPSRPGEDPCDRPELPLSCRRVRARRSLGPGRVRQVDLVADRTRREIVIPWEETRPDFEGEVAVVIGRRTYRATPENARQAIGGISALARRLRPQSTAGDAAAPVHARQELRHVHADGPAIASIDGVDLNDIEIRTTVSGEVMQDANTRDLIFGIEHLIVYLSAGVTLKPG